MINFFIQLLTLFVITWSFFVCLLALYLLFYTILSIKTYKITSDTEKYYITPIVLCLMFGSTSYRIYTAFYRQTLNIYDLLPKLNALLSEHHLMEIIVGAYCGIIGVSIIIILFLTMKLFLKKVYYHLHQSSVFPKILDKLLMCYISDPVHQKLWHLAGLVIKMPQNKFTAFLKLLLNHFDKYGLIHFYSFVLFIIFIMDILFNKGLLLWTYKVLPYYIILMLLHNIYSFIAQDRPYIHALISDIYYNFDNPRAFLLNDVIGCKISLFEVYDMEPEELSDESFKEQHYIYRVCLTPPGKVSDHFLTPDLSEAEIERRKAILKKINMEGR